MKQQQKRHRMRPHSPLRSGFTLIELLVVIAIIALLAAILAPVFAEARQSIYSFRCQSNLKEIGMGVMLYSSDYDERYAAPSLHSNGWMPDIHEPYLDSWRIWICPSDTKARTWDGVWASNSFFVRTSYIWNAYIFQGDPSNWRESISVASVNYPATTPLWMEGFANSGWIPEGAPISDPYPDEALIHDVYGDNANSAQNDTEAIACFAHRGGAHLDFIHHRGGNYVFADGHSKWMHPRGFTTTDILRNGKPFSDPSDPLLTSGARAAAGYFVCPVFCCPTYAGEPPGDGEHPWFRP